MMIDHSRIKNILVIKLRAVGDVLLSTVVLKSLRTAFPSAEIDFLTEKYCREVVEGNPSVDSVIAFDNSRKSGLSLIREVRQRHYDLVIDLFGNPRSALVTLFSGAANRIGYRFKWRQYCYNIVVEPRGGEVHNTEFNLDALRAINVSITDTSLHFPSTVATEKFAEDFFLREGLDDEFVVALNPGGGWYTKRWRIPKFAELGDYLIQQHDAKILIIWGPGEEPDARKIQALMKSRAVLIPSSSLKQLAALLGRCSALVTNDSGPMHIAAAMGIPIVAIYGPTNPELQSPVGSNHIIVQNQSLVCLGCNYTDCPIGNPCMEDLPVEAVLGAFNQLVVERQIGIRKGHYA